MKKWAYYNDSNPFAAAWARDLIKAGLAAPGEVDERPIQEVQPDDLRGFVQCHFFSGILGWSLALRIAGWPDDRPVWTGSCPCQPYSTAGKGAGATDTRNVWPEWFRLIRECRPVTIFGEQVEAAVRHGWLDAVSTDLEAADYAVGAAVLGAHSVGAPHIRQRLWWVADSRSSRLQGREQQHARGLAHTNNERAGGMEPEGADARSEGGAGNPYATHWRAGVRWVECRDGRLRPVPIESALFPLAPGLPGRVGLIRGAGNAIVPQVGAEFIAAWLDRGDRVTFRPDHTQPEGAR